MTAARAIAGASRKTGFSAAEPAGRETRQALAVEQQQRRDDHREDERLADLEDDPGDRAQDVDEELRREDARGAPP